jgi:hypothetical protein
MLATLRFPKALATKAAGAADRRLSSSPWRVLVGGAQKQHMEEVETAHNSSLIAAGVLITKRIAGCCRSAFLIYFATGPEFLVGYSDRDSCSCEVQDCPSPAKGHYI